MPDVHRLNSESDVHKRIDMLEREVHALRRSNQNYRGIIENMELGILEVDLDERIVRAYPKFCDLVGYTEEDLLGQNARDMFLADDLHSTMDLIAKKRNRGESGLYEMPIRTKSGEIKWLLISGVPLRNLEGDIVGSMGTHYDITERKKEEGALRIAKETAERAQMVEREFLARMSHEIRTPLNAIMGMSSLMSDSGLSEEQREFLAAIQNSSTLLHSMLSGLLDLSKLEADKMEVKRVPTVASKVISDVVGSFGPILSAKKVEVKSQWSKALDEPFLLDGRMLTQVLVNLVGNAVKFTEEGHIEVNAKWSKGPEKGRLTVEVNDTGIGISKVDQQHVFNRFKQASNRKVQHGGTGLGLALVQQMCRLHGGDVSVESQLGKGSSFRFHFAAEKASAPRKSGQNSGLTLDGLRVLVAEDNAANVLIVETLLKRWGCLARVVGNGLEAVDACAQDTFDMVLMDIEMPLCDGKESTQLIRAAESKLSKRAVPIVGLSAFAFEEDKMQAIEAGMNGFLSKPFTEAELKAIVVEQLANAGSKSP